MKSRVPCRPTRLLVLAAFLGLTTLNRSEDFDRLELQARREQISRGATMSGGSSFAQRTRKPRARGKSSHADPLVKAVPKLQPLCTGVFQDDSNRYSNPDCGRSNDNEWSQAPRDVTFRFPFSFARSAAPKVACIRHLRTRKVKIETVRAGFSPTFKNVLGASR